MAFNELQLIQSVASGESEAFATLDDRYRARLTGFLQGRQQLTREEAEDVVQDVFTTLLDRDCAALRSFEGRSSFYTYLCAIALRRLYRQRRRQLPVTDPPPEMALDPGIDRTAAELDATQVRQAMTALPEQFRTALMLHHFGGMEYHEIAELLGVPANTVATRICRAKRRLRELLTL